MIRRFAFLPLLLTGLAVLAQPPAPPVNASISGVVKDKGTGAPLKDYVVSTYVNATWSNGGITMRATTKPISSVTDEQGRYQLNDLPPALYHLTVRSSQGFGENLTRIVTLAGHDLEGIDFNSLVEGTISGKVLDENKEPLTGLTVWLVSKEYYLGAPGYFLSSSGRTNDRGEYTISRVQPGHSYYLMAEKINRQLPAHAETPLNPKMRKLVPTRTWYPGSPSKDGAAAIVLNSGEKRDGVDIDLKRSPSYCISGIASASGGPAEMSVSVEGLQPSSGVSNGAGLFSAVPTAITARDGEFRICDLYPGAYRLTVHPQGNGPLQAGNSAIANIVIADQDLSDLRIPTSPGLSMDVEVVLEGAAPRTPIQAKPNVNLTPLLRTQINGEKLGGRPDIPGSITLSNLLIDDYTVRATINAPGLYVRDVTYGDRSVFHEPLHLGSAMSGTGLRVAIAQDGAILSAAVADKDGNPVSDAQVLVMPADAASEGALAARIVSGQTDQQGHYKSDTLAPGKYFVAATRDSYDMAPESIGKLWQSHASYQEVELPPSGSVQVNLQPVGIR